MTARSGFEPAAEYVATYFKEHSEAATNERAERWFADGDGIESYSDLENVFDAQKENDELIEVRRDEDAHFRLQIAMGERISYIAALRHAVRTQYMARSNNNPRTPHDVLRHVAAYGNSMFYRIYLFIQKIALELLAKTGGG